MTAPPLFSPKVLTALAATIAVAFFGSLLLTGFGGEAETGDTIGTNSYSRSAIGHAGFFEVLRSTDVRVVRSQNDTLAKLGPDGVLVLAEPSANLTGELHRPKIQDATTILLVLPKWRGRRSDRRRDWIGEAGLFSPTVAETHFRAVAAKGTIVQVTARPHFSVNEMPFVPSVSDTIQLVKDSGMRPLIATSDGVLLGEITDRNRRIMVLSDPDIIQNHGIGQGDNAALVVALIERLRRNDSLVVFDETIHGFQSVAMSATGLILGFPYWLIGLQALVAIGLLLLASTGRFGAPWIRPSALGIDKRALITNTARLIDYGGHHADLLRRYALINLQDAARALRAPRGLSAAALVVWLDQVSRKRGTSTSASALIDAMNSAPPGDLSRQFAGARKLFLWKKELLDGPARRK